jgi:hypothetical protein
MYKKGELIAYRCGRDFKKNIVYKVGIFLGLADVYDEKSDWGVYGTILTSLGIETVWLHGSHKVV